MSFVSTLQRIVILALSCQGLSVAFGCGSSILSQSVSDVAQVKVDVSPATSVLSPGTRQRFTARVRGTSNSGVIWASSDGSIASDGTFIAPLEDKATQVIITATSVIDSNQRASSVVTVRASQQLAISTGSVSDALVDKLYNTDFIASGGTAPYHWKISEGSLPPGMLLQSKTGTLTGMPTQEGPYSFTVKVIDSKSTSATKSVTLAVSAATDGAFFDGPAELPRIYLNTALANTPATGSTVSVSANGDLQRALDNANCGETIELQAGAIFAAGQYKLPAKACDDQHWIIVRTSASDDSLPPEGTRMTPCYAGVSSLPGRPALACTSTQKVLATISYWGTGNGPIIFADGANHYRLLGLEITRAANDGKPVTSLIAPEKGRSMNQIVLDRLYIHGTSRDETRRGVELSGGTNVAVQDSYISDLHCQVKGTCTDSQAVSGGTGTLPTGPIRIVDNFLEASGENILFGGGKATQSPADIEIRRNHFFKPMFWMEGQPRFAAPAFIVKNHFELKNAQRVLVDSNIMENVWGGFSQYGFSVLLTPKNQESDGSNVCPQCQVTDVTIRYGTISHVAGAFVIGNVATPNGGVALDGQRYSIHDVIADDIDGKAYAGHGTFAEVVTVAHPLLKNVKFNHVTAFPKHTMLNIGGPNNPKMSGFVFTNSIIGAGLNPVWSTGGGSSNCAYYDIPVKTMNQCFSAYVFSKNAILGSPYPRSSWPTGNIFYDTAGIGFVNFSDGGGGDYHLQSSSPAIAAASDGGNLGADVNAVLNAIDGVQ